VFNHTVSEMTTGKPVKSTSAREVPHTRLPVTSLTYPSLKRT
jgi:hypothetical protein